MDKWHTCLRCDLKIRPEDEERAPGYTSTIRYQHQTDDQCAEALRSHAAWGWSRRGTDPHMHLGTYEG